MLPILVAQISTAGITFINTTMAGHAGSDDLAGVSVGAGLFYPLLASIVGLLMAGTPLMATLLGEKKPEGLPYVVRVGLLIGLVISFLFGAAYVLFIDDLLTSLTLEAEVAYVARYYLMTWWRGLLHLHDRPPSLSDGYGRLDVDFHEALPDAPPVNAVFNYLFIYGISVCRVWVGLVPVLRRC